MCECASNSRKQGVEMSTRCYIRVHDPALLRNHTHTHTHTTKTTTTTTTDTTTAVYLHGSATHPKQQLTQQQLCTCMAQPHTKNNNNRHNNSRVPAWLSHTPKATTTTDTTTVVYLHGSALAHPALASHPLSSQCPPPPLLHLQCVCRPLCCRLLQQEEEDLWRVRDEGHLCKDKHR